MNANPEKKGITISQTMFMWFIGGVVSVFGISIWGAYTAYVYHSESLSKEREIIRKEVTDAYDKRISDLRQTDEAERNDLINQATVQRETQAANFEKRLADHERNAESQRADLVDREKIQRESEIAALESKLRQEFGQSLLNAKSRQAELEQAVARRDDDLNFVRQQLAAARENLQIKSDGVYIGLNDFRISQQAGLRLMATGAYYNFRNILVPNYAKQGWTLTDNIGPNQIAKYILNNTILTRPDRVDPKDIGWMPIAVLIAKDEELASANLGICAIRREDLADVATILTGYKFRFSPTLNQMPLGILAQMATTTYFSTADFADANARIIDFTAKRDAYYIAVASKRENVQTVTEIVAFESGDDVICAISHYRSDFPMSPTVIEARAWIKEVRVLAP